jgi:hypothetical protein
MWRRGARLLVGFSVLGASCFSIAWLGINCTHMLQKQAAPPPKREPVAVIDPNFAKDPAIDAAKIKVIGPLANAMNSQGELSAISGDEANATKTDNAESAPQNAGPASPFDLVGHGDPQDPRHFHATFRVTNYKYFRLVVPAHSSLPKLHGTFASFSGDQHRTAVASDFLVLDSGQLNDFVHRTGGDSVFSHESCGGVIDVMLSPTIFDPKEYYLVFSSPDNHSRLITADLTATFD